MTDKQIVEAAKSAEKKTEFGELVHSKVSRGVNSAYGIGFLEGAEWARKQMMEDAVEGEVCKDHIVTEKPFYFYQSRLIELPDNLKEGDKVKIVIVKEDKK